MEFNFYGKYYESMGAGQCRFWYHFSIGWLTKGIEKKNFGYWHIYYDGYFHFFNLWPIELRWHKRAITKLEYQEHTKTNKQ